MAATRPSPSLQVFRDQAPSNTPTPSSNKTNDTIPTTTTSLNHPAATAATSSPRSFAAIIAANTPHNTNIAAAIAPTAISFPASGDSTPQTGRNTITNRNTVHSNHGAGTDAINNNNNNHYSRINKAPHFDIFEMMKTPQPKRLEPSPMPLKPIHSATANFNPATRAASNGFTVDFEEELQRHAALRGETLSPLKPYQPRQAPITATPPSRSSVAHTKSAHNGPGYVPIAAPRQPSFATDSPVKPQQLQSQSQAQANAQAQAHAHAQSQSQQQQQQQEEFQQLQGLQQSQPLQPQLQPQAVPQTFSFYPNGSSDPVFVAQQALFTSFQATHDTPGFAETGHPAPPQFMFAPGAPNSQNVSGAASIPANIPANVANIPTGPGVSIASVTQPQQNNQLHGHIALGSENNPAPTLTPSSNVGPASVAGKRALMDAAPLKERPAKKQKREEPQNIPILDPRTVIQDDGTKPHYSYAALITIAIVRSAHRRLTLAQIYKWISDNFTFYRAGDSGWQNSIRHNLSLNKHFSKQERPKDDPGKGHYWTVEAGAEYQILKEKSSRRPATMATMPLPLVPQEPQPQRLPAQQQLFQSTPAPPASVPAPAPVPPPASLPPQPAQSQPQPVELPTADTTVRQVAPIATSAMLPLAAGPTVNFNNNHNISNNTIDLSSDATLTASDPALHEDSADEVAQQTVRPSIEAPHSSPPQIVIKSSPPLALAPPPPPPPFYNRQATPPTPTRGAASAAAIARSRKRNAAAMNMNDSGYFSSLESSAMRPHKARRISNSELDIEQPRIKRGRAEDEIRRMLSSPHDATSPRRRSGIHRNAQYLAPGSSPLRTEHTSMGPPQPLTPALTHKKVLKPPASLSPNTNLRNYRKKIQHMVNSPLKNFGLADDAQPPSPAFNIEENFIDNSHKENSPGLFSIEKLRPRATTPIRDSPTKGAPRLFEPNPNGPLVIQLNESPLRRTPSDPERAERYKYFKRPPRSPPSCRNNELFYTDGTHDDLFAFELFTSDEEDSASDLEELEGVDLLKGFKKMEPPNHGKCMVLGHFPLPPHCRIPQ